MYVYANNDGLVLNEASGGTVMLRPGDVWFADDPFVVSRRDLFSATPTLVHGTTGRQALPATPVEDAVVLTVDGADVDVAEYAVGRGRGRGRRA